MTSDSTNTTQSVNAGNTGFCVPPTDIFTTAGAISLLFYKELTYLQTLTLINLLTLVLSNLGALVTQIEINKGEPVQPPF